MTSPHRPIPCSRCGFDLTGASLGGVCPECGTRIGRAASPMLPSGGATASLVCGICSIVAFMFCGLIGLPLGIIARIMGRKALERIQMGEADPSGVGSANSGRTCGLIGIILNSVVLMVYVGYVVLVGLVFSAFP